MKANYLEHVTKTFFSMYPESDAYEAVKTLYSCYVSDYRNFEHDFESLFSLPYSFVFGKLSYDDAMLSFLDFYYRNELFVKRALEYSAYLKMPFIEELPLLESRVDIASVDGYSYAFEIKTKYDTLQRLEKQINDYSKCFEKVYVVCSSDKYSSVVDIIPCHCGILTYSDSGRCNFRQKRAAKISKNMDANEQLKFMHLNELRKNFHSTERDKISKEFSSFEINIAFKRCVENRIKKKEALQSRPNIALHLQ